MATLGTALHQGMAAREWAVLASAYARREQRAREQGDTMLAQQWAEAHAWALMQVRNATH